MTLHSGEATAIPNCLYVNRSLEFYMGVGTDHGNGDANTCGVASTIGSGNGVQRNVTPVARWRQEIRARVEICSAGRGVSHAEKFREHSLDLGVAEVSRGTQVPCLEKSFSFGRWYTKVHPSHPHLFFLHRLCVVRKCARCTHIVPYLFIKSRVGSGGGASSVL